MIYSDKKIKTHRHMTGDVWTTQNRRPLVNSAKAYHTDEWYHIAGDSVAVISSARKMLETLQRLK